MNIANQQAFTALIGVAIIMFYIPYLGVTAPLLRARIRGEWPRPEHGPYFNLRRWGLPVNAFAVVYGVLTLVSSTPGAGILLWRFVATFRTVRAKPGVVPAPRKAGDARKIQSEVAADVVSGHR